MTYRALTSNAIYCEKNELINLYSLSPRYLNFLAKNLLETSSSDLNKAKFGPHSRAVNIKVIEIKETNSTYEFKN